MGALRISALCVAAVMSVSSAHAVVSDSDKLTHACQVAKDYVGLVNKQDVKGLENLFAQGADYTGPTGASSGDPAVIAAGYKHGFDNMKGPDGKPIYPSKFQIDNLLPFEKDGCLLEFSMWDDKANKFVLSAVDRFRVNEQGKVTQFLPYFSSAQLPKINAQIERIKASAAAAKEAK
jgi:hypothetical protein